MKNLAIDIETYSSVPLSDAGVHKYAESPDFEILLFGYSADGAPVQVVDFTKGEKLPDDVMEALYDPEVLKTAFNAPFERTCIGRWFDRRCPASEWQCTAVLARELGLPSSLEAVGKAMGLPEDQQKNKIGRALIRYFSIPCRPTRANGGRTRNLPAHAPEKWELYKQYNAQDVVAEQAIRAKLLKYQVLPKEWKLWQIDQNINDRGVRVNKDLAASAVEMDAAIKSRLFQEAQDLTGLDNPKSVKQIKDWIQEKTGTAVESLNKKSIGEVREKIDNKAVTRLLDIRAGLSKTSTEKYRAMLRTACADDRIRGLSMFYGAARTGRWAGRLVQMQNLPQNKINDKDLNTARELVLDRDQDSLELLFDDVPGLLSQLIRTAFIPAPGNRFLVADFSAIEARVLAWLAGEDWRMQVFRTHGKIYEASAEQMFKLPPGSVKKGDPMRQKGKIAELALGYGGSVGALKSMGALEMGLTEEELQPLVNKWRAANRKITDFWWNVDAAVRDCIGTGQPQKLPWGMLIFREGPLMRLRLPSGRCLSYVHPRIVNENIVYDGVYQTSGGWGPIESYGPKFVENIVQATARDCLAEAMMRLEAKGYRVVFHVHDEVILDVPKDFGSLEEVSELMTQGSGWNLGLPLKVDAYECEYYRKD